MTTYLSRHIATPTPQSAPLDDHQVMNEAGGYVYPVDDAVRMHRFLIMGSENGSHYTDEHSLTKDMADATQRHIAADGIAAVDHIVDVAKNRRAPRVSPILFALALAASSDSKDTRTAALHALPTVAGTASQLEEFATYVNPMRGWGRSLRSAIERWYTEREAEEVALQAVKFRTRVGWSHRDLLRKAHPKVEKGSDLWHIFDWITQGNAPPERAPFRIIHAYLEAQACEDVKRVAQLVTNDRLPREAVPTVMLQHDEIWQALGPQMPPLAFVRNLPALTAHNAIRPMEAAWAVERLRRMRSHTREDGSVRPAPVHPFHILLASMVYRMGQSIKGDSKWTPVPQVSAALDEAFEQSFSAAPATEQRVYLAIDTSGSMGSHALNGIAGFTARMAASAVTMVIARREPNHFIVACSDRMEDLHVTTRDSLFDTMQKTSALPYQRTDMALPILHAAQNRIPVDVFIIATDGQTYAGNVHPKEALRQYRQKMGIPAKAVQLAFVTNKYSIFDPRDAGTMDLVGFDAAMPLLLHDFMTA